MLQRIVSFYMILMVLVNGIAPAALARNVPHTKGFKVEEKHMRISSPEFDQGKPIPKHCGCQGKNLAPELIWEGIPEKAASLALVCDDPDAPHGTYLHWLVVNIPPTSKGISAAGQWPDGTEVLANTAGQKKYMGPCPPSGTHRYFFKLYALDVPIISTVNRTNYTSMLEQHTLEKAEYMGTYSH